MLSMQLSCQPLAFEMNVDHQSVGTMNNADSIHITNNNVHGSYADDSQHNRVVGNGNAIQSQFKACEGSSNDNAGSAVCCASKAGGACCASAAEAGHDASTSTDCPEHMPFVKKFEVRSRPAEAQLARPLPKPIRVVLIYIISVLSTMILRFLHGWSKQGNLDGVGAEMPGNALPETESLCQCESSDLESSAAVQVLHLHTAIHANGAMQKRHWRCMVCLALSCAVAAAILAFSPQASLVLAKTSQELGLTMDVTNQTVDKQYNADSMIINYIDGDNQMPKSVNFGDDTMVFHKQYRFLWDMDHLPAGDPDRDTLATVRHLLGSGGLEMYWDDEKLILDQTGSRMEAVFAGLSSSAVRLQWALDYNPASSCMTLAANINGRVLSAQSSSDGHSASHLHLDECNGQRPQCWLLHHSSRKIQNSETGECIGISSTYVSVQTQHIQEVSAFGSGLVNGAAVVVGVGLTAAATGGVSLLIGAAAMGATVYAMPKDPLTISVVMTHCDSAWTINWNMQEA